MRNQCELCDRGSGYLALRIGLAGLESSDRLTADPVIANTIT